MTGLTDLSLHCPVRHSQGLDEHAGKHDMTGKDAFGEAVYNASKDAKAPK